VVAWNAQQSPLDPGKAGQSEWLCGEGLAVLLKGIAVGWGVSVYKKS
jgi:hypothetical protein